MKTSVYLPDDLAARVRALGIPMSEVVQAALRQAVADAEAIEQAKAQIMPDIEVAVTRLRGILAEEERARQAERAKGRDVGVVWARDYATPRELKEMTSSFPPPKANESHSLSRFCDEHPELTEPAKRIGATVRLDIARSPWWAGFRHGAAEVWEAVQPILERERPT